MANDHPDPYFTTETTLLATDVEFTEIQNQNRNLKKLVLLLTK